MSPTLANFLFEVGNFLVLAGVLGWLLFKPVRRTLDVERDRHEQQEAESNRLRAEAESLVAEARAARQKTDHEVDQRRKQILETAEKEASLLLQEARKTQHSERQALHEELVAMRGAEARAVAETVGQLAATAVRQLLEVLPGPSMDMALIRSACAELGALSPEARRSATVESARPLDADAIELLKASLGSAFRERVVPELGAGVRITTPAGQVDATATSIARRAGRTVSGLALGSTTEMGAEASHG